MATTISDRIRDALAQPGTSAELSELSRAAAVERDSILANAEVAKAKATDPREKASDADAAKRRHEDLTFRADRLKTAISELDAVIDRVRSRERQGELRERYDAAKAAQAEMVADLNEHYPALAYDLMNLLERYVAVERKIQAANASLPPGAERIPSVEQGARGIDNHSAERVPPLYNAVRLPHLDKHEAGRGLLHSGSPSWSLPL